MPVRSSIRSGSGGVVRNSSPTNNMWEMERRYSVPANEQRQPSSVLGSSSDAKLRRSNPVAASHTNLSTVGRPPPHHSSHSALSPSASEDLHAWSIYRQNLNSDFTDSALGSSEKSPLPYGNFQLRESTVQSILSHPRYGPKSPLGSNMYTYLKFGLPRVFPPNGRGRDGSSGYDSSEEGATTPHASNDKRQQSYYLRTRSDPDFRNAPYYGPSMRPSGNIRGKSCSEANLLSPDAIVRHTQLPVHKTYRRSVHDLRTMSELVQPPNQYLMHPPSSHLGNGRPASIAVSSRPGCHSLLDASSGVGLINRTNHSLMDNGAPPSIINAATIHHMQHTSFQQSRQDVYNGLYPHLQIRGLDLEVRKNEYILHGLSFEIRAGELLAIMSTTELEGKSVLEALAVSKKTHVHHIVLNGQNVTLSTLRRRMIYVRHDAAISPHLNVAQTLTFHSHLRQPPKLSVNKSSITEQIGVLIEELGLAQVLSTSVSELTPSEVQRLKIACYLLSDAEILLLDRPTTAMDIFDTFFLVEFLRQWANGGPTGMTGKAVILTLQPPTYEIFTMISRVALISSGRMMFYGRRRDMLPYFASVDYPCPAYKNPSDYYLDLVTLDELSAEAMLESNQRIEQLADVFRHRQEPLSDPGPPQPLPGKPRTASFLFQIVAIILRQMVYSQPQSFISWISRLLIALFLSIFIGAVFWDILTSDPQLTLNDRISFHYTMMHIGSLPVLLVCSLSDIHGKDRAAVESDIKDRLYSRFVYIIILLLCKLPASLVIWLAYLVPSYAMSSLYQQQANDADAFYIYLGYMILHMCALQSILTLIGYFLPARFLSSVISVFAMLLLNLTSGYPLQLRDISMYWLKEWLGVISPTRWILPIILEREFSEDTLDVRNSHSPSQLRCRNKQVQHQDIIVQLPCPTPNGTAALRFYGMLINDVLPHHFRHLQPVWMTVICWTIPALVTVIIFIIFGKYCTKNNRRKY